MDAWAEFNHPCSQCNGTGKSNRWDMDATADWGLCSHCNGSGREPEDWIVRVPIYTYEIHAS